MYGIFTIIYLHLAEIYGKCIGKIYQSHGSYGIYIVTARCGKKTSPVILMPEGLTYLAECG